MFHLKKANKHKAKHVFFSLLLQQIIDYGIYNFQLRAGF